MWPFKRREKKMKYVLEGEEAMQFIMDAVKREYDGVIQAEGKKYVNVSVSGGTGDKSQFRITWHCTDKSEEE